LGRPLFYVEEGKDGAMLKVIAEDFIKPEHVEAVMPL
jgi:hypothetical protein